MVSTIERVGTHRRLHRLKVENFCRLQQFEMEPEGHHTIISARNGCGKTSLVSAWLTALRAITRKEIPEPVRKGADKARIEADLGDIRICIEVGPKGDKVEVFRADGSQVKDAGELLKSFKARVSRDPVAFIDLRPQDQVDQVLKVLGIAPPIVRVQEITGEHHEPRPGESAAVYLERLSADETGHYYVLRREQFRIADQKRKAAEEQRQVLAALGGPILEEEPASASAFLAEIERLTEQDKARRNAAGEIERARMDLDDIGRQREALASLQKTAEMRCAEMERQIARLQGALAEERKQLVEAQQKDEQLGKLYVEQDDFVQSLHADFGKLPDPAPRLADLRRRIATVESTNKALARRRAAQEQLERLLLEQEEAQREHERRDAILEALRRERLELLATADIGIPGLTMGEKELRLDGVPLAQASMAQRMAIAAMVLMKQGGEVSVFWVDEGQRLDDESTAQLLRIADQHDWQVVLNRVSSDSELKVEIVTGSQTEKP